MNKLLFLIAFILIATWAIGFYAYNAGHLIHILLVLAALAALLNISSKNNQE